MDYLYSPWLKTQSAYIRNICSYRCTIPASVRGSSRVLATVQRDKLKDIETYWIAPACSAARLEVSQQVLPYPFNLGRAQASHLLQIVIMDLLTSFSKTSFSSLPFIRPKNNHQQPIFHLPSVILLLHHPLQNSFHLLFIMLPAVIALFFSSPEQTSSTSGLPVTFNPYPTLAPTGLSNTAARVASSPSSYSTPSYNEWRNAIIHAGGPSATFKTKTDRDCQYDVEYGDLVKRATSPRDLAAMLRDEYLPAPEPTVAGDVIE